MERHVRIDDHNNYSGPPGDSALVKRVSQNEPATRHRSNRVPVLDWKSRFKWSSGKNAANQTGPAAVY